MRKNRNEFHKLSKSLGIPINTLYNWASGRTAPSSKYTGILELFWMDGQKNNPGVEEVPELVINE